MTTALVGYYDYDSLRLRYRANAAPAALDAYVVYEQPGEPGKAYKDAIPSVTSFTTDWTEQTLEGDPAGGSPGGCNITGGGIQLRSSATSLVKGSLYARLVVARGNTAYEECLCCGYLYDAKPFLSVGEHGGLETSEAVAFMDVTYTQANVGGGAVVVEITPGAGSSFDILDGRAVNSGTNTVRFAKYTAAGGTEIVRYVDVASGATTTGAMPRDAVGYSANTAAVISVLPPTIPGTQTARVSQTGAGGQNDTFRILITILVKGALPTVSKANSTNQADVTVTSGAATFAFVS